MTTVRNHSATDGSAASGDAADHRRRLLAGLSDSIAAGGYRRTTVGDIVRHARTSRRTFYEHFSGKEDCLAALLTENNQQAIREISAAVDPTAAWQAQIRQAVSAWVAHCESCSPVTLSWIRDLPALSWAQHEHRAAMDAYISFIQAMCDTELMRAAGVGPISRQRALILLGGLRELLAATLEEGGRPTDIAEVAADAAIAILGPRP